MNRSLRIRDLREDQYLPVLLHWEVFHWQLHQALFTAFRFPYTKRKNHSKWSGFSFGDPYGNRTHVTAVKGRCLNRLTNGPGSGDLIRTGDIPGMNRLLYQLSYAAIWSKDLDIAEISFLIIPKCPPFVKKNILFF